jgi:hypothetical protein
VGVTYTSSFTNGAFTPDSTLTGNINTFANSSLTSLTTAFYGTLSLNTSVPASGVYSGNIYVAVAYN